MAPQRNVEFVYLNLTYAPQLNPLFPRITFRRKKHSPECHVPHTRHWLDRTMCKETFRVPVTMKVRYCEWNIMTSNADLFTIYGYRFDNVLLVLGEETMYWLYFHNKPMLRSLEGYGRLVDSYCTCCLHNQYIKIMQSVKGCIMKLGQNK